jgi:RNA polymerase sigma-70 factor, ECF subfamily
MFLGTAVLGDQDLDPLVAAATPRCVVGDSARCAGSSCPATILWNSAVSGQLTAWQHSHQDVSESLTSTLERAYTTARAMWPSVVVTSERFAAEVARRLGAELSPSRLASMCAVDVYLAIACLDGDEQAIRILEREYLIEVDHAARKTGATDEQAIDVRGHLHRILFVAEPGRGAGLAEFNGRGDLRGYLKVIATRELIRIVSRGRREHTIEPLLDSFDLSFDLGFGLDLARAPELSLMRARYGSIISQVMRAAVEELAERPRALLRYSLVGGWSIDRIAALYGIHRATAARWLAAARDALADSMRAKISAQLVMPVDDVDSIVRLVRSQIDVSLARIL